jgi:predicted ATPase/class 3 adenylate cyclase
MRQPGLIMGGVKGNLPAGLVTFLFTDIEGSTKLLHELGAEAYADRLADHRRLLRDAFGRHGGVEVDTQGDAFFVAFGDAAEAVAAAAEAQQALAAGPIKVRMGLHSGRPHLSAEGYVGPEVHLGARIAAVGHGGQVLLSAATRAALDASQPVTDLGEHRLKDFAEAVWIYQLSADRFPPLKSISNTNLPRPASAFVGREKELTEITELLRDGARLLTLTGTGGTGKTRLSIEAASALVPDFRNGTFWVDLAPLTDPALVPATIATTIGAKDELASYIGHRELLLVLDNLEQVIEAGSEVATLVSASPNLRVLATSRERLRVQGETEYAVPPLATHEAVELFAERSGLEPHDTIGELCRRLDNLPLAVELAAARTSVLSPAQILERLSKRLDLLKGGRDAEARQATLRATIEWSHDLLNAEEKRLFALLAVFAGGWTLEAAESVAEADLDVLESLVDKSLVGHTDERFAMLETIRQFATERLEASGEADELRQRHAEFFLHLAEEAEAKIEQDQKSWLPRLEAEIENIRTALDRLEVIGQLQRAMQMAGCLANFWEGHIAEGRTRLERLLTADERPSPERAKALVAAALLALQSGDSAFAEHRARDALGIYRDIGDARGTANATLHLGMALADQADFASARDLFEASVPSFRDIGDEVDALFSSRLLAWMYEELGERERAGALMEDNLVWARRIGNKPMEAQALGALAGMAIDQGRAGEAVSLLKDVLRIDRDNRADLQTALDLTRFARALSFAGTRDADAAAVLSSGEALRAAMGAGGMPYAVQNHEQALAILRTRLDESVIADAWVKGAKLAADEAVALALGETDA